MDQLRQAIALHIGLLALDGLEAKTELAAAKRERDSAIRQAEILRGEQKGEAPTENKQEQ